MGRDRASATITRPERQFGTPRGEPTFYQQVEAVLVDAGFTCGRFHTGSGWSDWGDLEYRPPLPGYVIDRSYIGQLYVDHAGRGRQKMLPLYLEALEKAGFASRIDGIDYWQLWTRLIPGRKKEVVWTDLWDPYLDVRRRHHEENRRERSGDVGGVAGSG